MTGPSERTGRGRASTRSVDAYEAARALGDPADLAAFLPSPDHPEYLAILCELVRVDLEYSWQGEGPGPHRLDHYRERFPELFQDRRCGFAEEIAFEEFRLRRQAGEDLSPLGVPPPLRRRHAGLAVLVPGLTGGGIR